MDKILVTGGLGFIGSHTVVELIDRRYEVYIVDDLSNSEKKVLNRIKKITGVKSVFFEIDLTNKAEVTDLLSTIKIDSVIHFSASKAVGESIEKPLFYYRNNLISLLNVLEGCAQFKVNNMVFSSSCTVYGQPDILPVTEESPKKLAESPYGNTKQICEEMIEDYCKSTNHFKAISLRYFNPVGAHESGLIGELPLGIPNNLVPFITQTAVGIRKKLNVFGGDYNTPDGTCIRDYIHVVDLAKAHIDTLKYCSRMKNKYDFFNAGTGKGASVLQVIESFEKISRVSLNYEIVDRRAGDIEEIYADTTKINEELGWTSKRDLDSMMSSAWKWQKSLKEP